MLVALHPVSKKSISVDEYILEYGEEQREYANRALCPFLCGDKMTLVRQKGIVHHFAHFGDYFCPSKEDKGPQYKNSPPKNPDAKHAAEILEIFKNNLKRYYKKLKELIPFILIQEFEEILNAAKKLHIWHYSQIKEFQLPYIFASLIDFHPQSPKKYKTKSVRELHFRFIFSHVIRCYDDLIEHEQQTVHFLRASYKQNKKTHAHKIYA
ncbi:MAG: hypothetical protein LBC14_08980 [Desulfovibrio sp.]|jgi:hypothetical protein|nr:hypothetical protein [Desulfovibrio sp.]